MSGVAHNRAPLASAFDISAKNCKPKSKRPAPVSVRFDAEERARLERDAAGMSLADISKAVFSMMARQNVERAAKRP